MKTKENNSIQPEPSCFWKITATMLVSKGLVILPCSPEPARRMKMEAKPATKVARAIPSWRTHLSFFMASWLPRNRLKVTEVVPTKLGREGERVLEVRW